MTSWRLGVVGSPIEHSLSPQLHEAGLRYVGLEGTSVRRDIDEQHVDQLREIMGVEFDALSLTMPLKALAATKCDELDERAHALGVVNSLLWRDGRLLGASTDGAGFVDSLRGELGADVSGRNTVVLGSGGAARAIVDSLLRANANSVAVLGRNAHSVAEIVATDARVVDRVHQFRPVDLIVNTTPSSSRGEDAAVLQGVSRDTIVVDITYSPSVSPWLALHADLGCVHLNGLAMLAYTVARQMNWWWNSEIPGAYLLGALVEALK